MSPSVSSISSRDVISRSPKVSPQSHHRNHRSHPSEVSSITSKVIEVSEVITSEVITSEVSWSPPKSPPPEVSCVSIGPPNLLVFPPKSPPPKSPGPPAWITWDLDQYLGFTRICLGHLGPSVGVSPGLPGSIGPSVGVSPWFAWLTWSHLVCLAHLVSPGFAWLTWITWFAWFTWFTWFIWVRVKRVTWATTEIVLPKVISSKS